MTRIAVDPEVGACLAELARGVLAGETFRPDGLVEFEIDREVEAELRRRGEDLCATIRRVLERKLGRKIPRWEARR